MTALPAALPAALLAIADAQAGLVRRAQALQFLSLSALRHHLSADWSIVLPGVYLTYRGTMSEAQRHRAALLYAGDSAQLADVTSLIAHGVRDVPSNGSTHVLIPATEHRASKAFVTVRRTHRLPVPDMLAGLPCCPLARSLAAASARIGDLQSARALIADAVQRELVTTGALRAELPHLAGRGAGVARRAIENILAGARSAPECEFLDLCATIRGLPRPWVNCLIQLPCGRLVSPDALWVAARLIHETNSARWHAGPDDFDSTQERAAALVAAGFVVVSSSPRQIRGEGRRIAGQIAALHRANEGRGLPPGVVVLRGGAE